MNNLADNQFITATNHEFDNRAKSLADVALLVNLTISKYQPYAYDEGATLDGFGSKSLGRANKKLLANSTILRDTTAAFNAVYTYYRDNTVPWKDEGLRMLPSKQYFEFTAAMRERIQEAENKLAALDLAWADEIEQDRLRFEYESTVTGKLCRFNHNDYPKDVTAKFGVKLSFQPVPTSGDFRVWVSDDDKAELDAAVHEAQENVTAHLLGEILKPLQALGEHLAKPIEDVKRFHDSIVLNVFEVTERAKKLNIMDDPTITSIIDVVEQNLGKFTFAPELIKESQTTRTEAQQHLEDVMSTFAGMF